MHLVDTHPLLLTHPVPNHRAGPDVRDDLLLHPRFELHLLVHSDAAWADGLQLLPQFELDLLVGAR